MIVLWFSLSSTVKINYVITSICFMHSSSKWSSHHVTKVNNGLTLFFQVTHYYSNVFVGRTAWRVDKEKYRTQSVWYSTKILLYILIQDNFKLCCYGLSLIFNIYFTRSASKPNYHLQNKIDKGKFRIYQSGKIDLSQLLHK